MSSEDNFTRDAIEGMTKGALEFSKEEIKGLIYKIRNKDLLFIGRKETIDRIKRNRYSEEWTLFNRYIENKDLRIIVQIGMTLRDIEGDEEERKRLQNILLERYGGWGLHIAHFVQTGFLSNFIGRIIKERISQKALKEDLEELLRNVDKYIVFIKGHDDVDKVTEILKNRIQVNLPKVLMIYSIKSTVQKAKKIKKKLSEEIENYGVNDMSIGKDRYICFFLRDDDYYKEDRGYFS